MTSADMNGMEVLNPSQEKKTEGSGMTAPLLALGALLVVLPFGIYFIISGNAGPGGISVLSPGSNFEWDDAETWFDEIRGDKTIEKIWRWGTLKTPLAPHQDDSPMLSLKVLVRVSPIQPAPLGSLLLHCGGPSSDATCAYSLVRSDTMDVDMLNKYNIFGISQRGTGASEPNVLCQNLTKVLPTLPEKRYTSIDDFMPGCPCSAMWISNYFMWGDMDSWTLGHWTSVAASLKKCYELDHFKSGRFNVLDYLGTTYLAHDLDRLRAAFGETKLNIYGASYGTWVGSVYASQYPENSGRIILDSNVPPAPTAFKWAEDYTKNLQKLLTEFFRRCEGIDCMQGDAESKYFEARNALVEGNFSAETDFGKVTLTHMLLTGSMHNSLRDHTPFAPVDNSSGIITYLGYANLIQQVVDANENSSTRAKFMEAELTSRCSMNMTTSEWWNKCVDKNGNHLGVKKNDNDTFFMCPTWKQYGVCAFDPSASSGVMYVSVFGGDVPSRFLPYQFSKLTTRLREQYGPIGEASSYAFAPWMSFFPGKSTYPGIGSGKVEPLIVGVLDDSATPYAFTQEMKLAFPNSHLLTWQGMHHGMPRFFRKHPWNITGVDDCVEMMQNYMLNGKLPVNGEVCHENVRGIDFVDNYDGLLVL